MPTPLSAAVAIHRRSMAIALFRGIQLEDIQQHQLPNDPAKAVDSLSAFIHRAISLFNIQNAFINGADVQSGRIELFYTQAEGIFRTEGIPIEKTSQSKLFESFRMPPLLRMDQLREIVRLIWPSLAAAAKPALDAAALGLHCAVERLFRINQPAQ